MIDSEEALLRDQIDIMHDLLRQQYEQRAQLQHERDMWQGRAEDMNSRLSAEQAENAKLRAERKKLRKKLRDERKALHKLATTLYRCAHGMFRDLAPSCADGDEGGCGMDCAENGEKCCMALIEKQMREAGIALGKAGE